jgi:WD40 repeat protein
MSISFRDNNIKLWNIDNWECILNLSEVNKNGFLDSACFLTDNNNYIITSNCYWGGYSEHIKVFDFNGNKIKEICNSNERTYFIDNFYDNIYKKNYIITGNENYVKSYDYNNNKLYHKYYEYDNRGHFSIEVHFDDNIIKLIESCFDGIIRIWNFHYNILLNKITVSNKALFGISLLNNNNLLVGCEDKTIKLIELKNGGIVQNLQSHYKWVISIKCVIHPKYGELIISQGYDNDKIRLWINNN